MPLISENIFSNNPSKKTTGKDRVSWIYYFESNIILFNSIHDWMQGVFFIYSGTSCPCSHFWSNCWWVIEIKTYCVDVTFVKSKSKRCHVVNSICTRFQRNCIFIHEVIQLLMETDPHTENSLFCWSKHHLNINHNLITKLHFS